MNRNGFLKDQNGQKIRQDVLCFPAQVEFLVEILIPQTSFLMVNFTIYAK